jgi:hypothetical protein
MTFIDNTLKTQTDTLSFELNLPTPHRRSGAP